MYITGHNRYSFRVDSTKIPKQTRRIIKKRSSCTAETRTHLQTDEQEMPRWLPARQESRNSATEVQLPRIQDRHR
jgi:hypothetical protein